MMEDNKFSRRKVLKSVGAAGISSGAIASFSGSAGAKQKTGLKNGIERNVNELSGSYQQRYVSNALSDSDVRKITKDFREKGWESKNSAGTVYRVDGADEDSDLDFSRYHVVMVPFQKATGSNSERKEVRLLWTDRSLESEGLSTPALFEAQEKSTTNTKISSQALDNGSKLEVTEYGLRNGKVTESTNTVDKHHTNVQTDQVISPPGGGTCSGFCKTKVLDCEDIGIWCYISLAAAYIGTYWACAACGFGAWVACGKCAVAVIGSGAGTVGCIEEADCVEKTVCRSRDEVDKKPCKICYNIHHPNC